MNTPKTRILISTCEDGHFGSAEAMVRHQLESRRGVEISQAKQREECERLADFDGKAKELDQ